ncbi:uncharacterized protein IWZ02DRAFT_479358 [Phyllosticta citriasiana]|uniref:uncharacterized protein n=1 Tax=Phyllosticta citriasiana TaxID=595635 RepID=UPI0030FDBCFE
MYLASAVPPPIAVAAGARSDPRPSHAYPRRRRRMMGWHPWTRATDESRSRSRGRDALGVDAPSSSSSSSSRPGSGQAPITRSVARVALVDAFRALIPASPSRAAVGARGAFQPACRRAAEVMANAWSDSLRQTRRAASLLRAEVMMEPPVGRAGSRRVRARLASQSVRQSVSRSREKG